MTCFLTSYPAIFETNELNPANGFTDRLKDCVPHDCSALFICSDPDCHELTDMFSESVKESFESSGFHFGSFRVLDGRNASDAFDLVRSADVIILAGGHVQTQSGLFSQINLKALLNGFDGVIVGISAGSMNCAETVYAHPEEEGEAIDPVYRRFLPGLGLTKKMIIPHYSRIKNDILDGLRVMEDIAYPDSRGREFLVLEDGSYLYIQNGKETICGEAYILADGVMTKILSLGEKVRA